MNKRNISRGFEMLLSHAEKNSGGSALGWPLVNQGRITESKESYYKFNQMTLFYRQSVSALEEYNIST